MSDRNGHRQAVGIVSGGLDSLLAIRLVQGMGFHVLGLHLWIGFEPDPLRQMVERPEAQIQPPPRLLRAGCDVQLLDIRSEFMTLLDRPPHGMGAHLNPCIDCKILMCRQARQAMHASGAAFVFSGEVLGQRPMSQRKAAMDLVERESGLSGLLVRPLCGRLLPPTRPEQDGLFDRDSLMDIQGRTRSRQADLARSLGIDDYPTPAGGCLLTDPQFARRAGDLLERRPARLLSVRDPLLLYVGRHLVLPSGSKVVIGRRHAENGVIEGFGHLGPLLTADLHPGPTTLIDGPHTADDRLAAARLTARYGQGRDQARVRVACRLPDGTTETLDVEPGEIPGSRML